MFISTFFKKSLNLINTTITITFNFFGPITIIYHIKEISYFWCPHRLPMANIHVEECPAQPTCSVLLNYTMIKNPYNFSYSWIFLTDTVKNTIFWWFLGLLMTCLTILKGQDGPTWSMRHPLWLYWAETWPESPCKESYSTFIMSISTMKQYLPISDAFTDSKWPINLFIQLWMNLLEVYDILYDFIEI